MRQHHNYDIGEIENMYPYERNIYVDMIRDYLDKVEKERKKN